MMVYNSFLFLRKKGLKSVVFMIALWLFAAHGFAQEGAFDSNSIPMVGDEVVFEYQFDNENQAKDGFRTQTYLYLSNGLEPHSNSFLLNSPDSVICRVVDYLEIEVKFLSVFGMYMIYDLKLVYDDEKTNLTISNISFIEMSDFESLDSEMINIDSFAYTGKDILVDKSYKPIFNRDASDKISVVAINRINQVINELEDFYSKESEIGHYTAP